MKTLFRAVCVSVVALAMAAAAQAATITYADARANFPTSSSGSATATPDSTGLGTWGYYAWNGSTSTATPLAWMGLGAGYGPGTQGFGSSTGGFNLPAVGAGKIFNDGKAPGANELAISPGGDDLVMRWTAGAGEVTGLVDVTGTIARSVSKPGAPFTGCLLSILVDGVSKYTLDIATNDITSHSFSVTGLSIATGSTVDFVYNAKGDVTADESLFSAQITSSAVPEPATITMLAMGLFGLIAYAWRKRK